LLHGGEAKGIVLLFGNFVIGEVLLSEDALIITWDGHVRFFWSKIEVEGKGFVSEVA
jgi:hypothetical protein